MIPVIPERVRSKVRGCIARAAHANTPEEEARNSAVAACKLLAEHGVLDLLDKAGNASTPSGSGDFEVMLLRHELATVRAELASTKADLAEQESLVRFLDKFIENRRRELDTLRAALAGTKKRTGKVEAERDALRVERDGLRAERDELRAERDTLRAALAAAGTANRTDKTATLRARVLALVASDRFESANQIASRIGGTRADVLAAVRELLGEGVLVRIDGRLVALDGSGGDRS